MRHLSLSVTLISLSMIFSRSIPVVANVKLSFFFMAESYSILFHIFFIHLACVALGLKQAMSELLGEKLP